MKTSKTQRVAMAIASLALSVTSLTAVVVPQRMSVWHHTGIIVAQRTKL